MRNLALIMLLGGILAFFFCQTQLSNLEPLGPNASLSDYVHNDAGRYEVARYVAAGAAAVGALLLLFPTKGR